MPWQAVFNKISLDPIPDELKDFKIFKKKLISKREIFLKNSNNSWKRRICKIKGSVCNIPIETSNTCNILPRYTDSNGLIVVKLKRDLNLSTKVMFVLSQYAQMSYTRH